MTMSNFLESKNKFDLKYKNKTELEKSLVTVDTNYKSNIKITNASKQPNEEYYKWQFIFALIDSGLYSKDYIGTEIFFPKGNKNSAPLRTDACIFDDENWFQYYLKWRKEKNDDAIEWLRKHLIGIIEFKKSNDKDIRKVFNSQVRAELKESENEYCLGIYYNTERLYLFSKKTNIIARYDDSKNIKNNQGKITDLSLELTDNYISIPSHEQLLQKINTFEEADRSKRKINDLDIITGLNSVQVNIAISNMLTGLDKVGLLNQRGYQILIQMLAMKIFDEKRSQKHNNYLNFYTTQKESQQVSLLFYISEEERNWVKLSDEEIQQFIHRMNSLYNDASIEYKVILKQDIINWRDESHVKAVSKIVENLQDYSLIRSYKSDLYQLVFYRFANEFAKAEKGQFITPLKLIDFLVQIINPRSTETVLDPTVGIADFLSMAYVNSKGTIDDKNLYGVDNDSDMIMLAQLNMLLNGDGNAILKYQPDFGSLIYKFNRDKSLVSLEHKLHADGNWDNWADNTQLMKFDIVLTNPPFGDNRKFEPKTKKEKEVAELYELWKEAKSGNSIDMGVLFVENAVRVLKNNGRLGIVISNSIASIDKWEKAREWMLNNLRIVAFFDLPAGAFADTGVNTTLLVAYKPTPDELTKLKKANYEVFCKSINNLGYEVKTTKRVKQYVPVYRVNDKFEVEIDEEGNPLLDEDFTQTIKDFKEWANNQEKQLKDLFL